MPSSGEKGLRAPAIPDVSARSRNMLLSAAFAVSPFLEGFGLERALANRRRFRNRK
jgi:hypothetical protein